MPWVASVIGLFPKAKSMTAVIAIFLTSFLLTSIPAVKAPPTSPTVISYYPANRQTEVPLTAPIYVNFSEPMDPASIQAVSVPDVTFSQTLLFGMNLTLNHGLPFAAASKYVVTINGMSLSGQWLDGNNDGIGGDPLTWTFWTYSPNPYIIETSPPDDAFNVPLNQPILVNFSKSVRPTDVGYAIEPRVTLMPAWPPSYDGLMLNPVPSFAPCTRYTVFLNTTVPPGPMPGAVPNPWSFTTIGCGPMIVSIDPPQTNVPLDAPIVITFTNSMDRATINISLFPAVPYVMGWQDADKILTLNHTEKFKPCTSYSLTVSGNDTGGVPLGSGPVPNPYIFSTVCTYPRVLVVVPPQDQTGVALDTPIKITFSESMDNKSVEDAFYCSDGLTRITVADGVVSWSPDFTLFTFNSSTPYRRGIWYTAFLNASIAHGLGNNFLDGNGNGVSEGSPTDDKSWQFRTTDITDTTPPTVVNVSPIDGATNQSKDPTIVVIFSEAMNKTSVAVANAVSVWRGTEAYGLAHNFIWTNNKTVSFSLLPQLISGVVFTVRISATVSDLSGNQMGTDYSWSFRVALWRGEVHGRVVDDADGSPIANATVTFQGIQTLTGADGNFSLDDVAEGSYLLNISKEGYDSFSSLKDVSPNIRDLGTMQLHKTGTQPSGPSPLIIFAALLVTVLLVLLLVFLVSRRRQKSQPTKFEEWKGEVAVVEREDER